MILITCVVEAGSTFMDFEAARAKEAMNGVVTIEATEIERHGWLNDG